MPLLAVDADFEIPDADADAFADRLTALYSDHMATGTGHVAVVVRDDGHLSLGRAVDGPRLFLQADIREGRSFDRRRSFALAAMDDARDRFGVPEPNLKVAFTEHAGDDLMGYDRVGGAWSPEEDA
ncbi:tautomerase [Salarchaeum japonicum]|uniref:tautomerase n=1 Tax=Salarchaeum japonicum TaxID=555573 RepID=UPI003C733E59